MQVGRGAGLSDGFQSDTFETRCSIANAPPRLVHRHADFPPSDQRTLDQGTARACCPLLPAAHCRGGGSRQARTRAPQPGVNFAPRTRSAEIADVGRTRDHDDEAIAKPFAPPLLCQNFLDLGQQRCLYPEPALATSNKVPCGDHSQISPRMYGLTPPSLRPRHAISLSERRRRAFLLSSRTIPG
jgi:hypothetical protein